MRIVSIFSHILISLLVNCFGFSCSQAQDRSQKSNIATFDFDGDRIRAFLLELMNRESIPGLAFAIFDHDSINHMAGFGVRNHETQEKITSNTIFRASSLSKPMFAYMVMVSEQDGQIDLDQPLHSLHMEDDLKDDERSKLVTARIALQHSTGMQNWRRDDPLRISFQPGATFGYSGEGYMFLQRAFEKITEKELNRVARETVFVPLDMNNSSYVWKSEFERLVALGHDSDGKHARLWRAEDSWSAGSLYTTVEDYTRFLQQILERHKDGNRTVLNMVSPSIELEGYDSKLFWGLGFGIETTKAGTYAWHWGSDSGYKSFFMLALEQNAGLVFFANGNNGLNIAKKVVNHFFPDDHPAFDWLHEEYGYIFPD